MVDSVLLKNCSNAKEACDFLKENYLQNDVRLSSVISDLESIKLANDPLAHISKLKNLLSDYERLSPEVLTEKRKVDLFNRSLPTMKLCR